MVAPLDRAADFFDFVTHIAILRLSASDLGIPTLAAGVGPVSVPCRLGVVGIE
jgi:hypothetical protein